MFKRVSLIQKISGFLALYNCCNFIALGLRIHQFSLRLTDVIIHTLQLFIYSLRNFLIFERTK